MLVVIIGRTRQRDQMVAKRNPVNREFRAADAQDFLQQGLQLRNVE